MDTTSEDFRAMYDLTRIKDYFSNKRTTLDYTIGFIKINPSVWLPVPNKETKKAKEARIQLQLHNTLLKAYSHPYESIRDNYSRDLRIDILEFNDQNISIVTHSYNGVNYPTEKEISTFLTKLGIPSSLEGLDVDQVFKLRKRYPYAWFNIDIPPEWREKNYDMFVKHFGSIKNELHLGHLENIDKLNEAIKSQWRSHSDRANQLLYKAYIGILDEMPPLANSIVLFRSVHAGTPKIGDEIVEHGFSTMSYLYTNKCCTLIISYPKNHKFLMPISDNKRILLEIMSYPGEVLVVDKVEDGNVFCHFVRYEPHMAPDGTIVSPPLTDIFDNAKGYSISVTLVPITM